MHACSARLIAGYGYRGRVAQRCDQGEFNEGGNQASCSRCELGLTTLAPGAGKIAADCWVAPGFGPNGQQCPVGIYNDQIRQDKTAPCFLCPLGTTTMALGSDSRDDCQCKWLALGLLARSCWAVECSQVQDLHPHSWVHGHVCAGILCSCAGRLQTCPCTELVTQFPC